MNDSRPLQQLCCLAQATLINTCLSEADLRSLNLSDGGPNRFGFSEALWRRASLHKACHRDHEAARKVSDRLDLRFLDTVVLVRCMEFAELEAMLNLWVSQPEGGALPGLLWALCTDVRDEVHALGMRLCHEAAIVALRLLVD